MKTARRRGASRNTLYPVGRYGPTSARGSISSLRHIRGIVLGGGLAAILALSISAYWVASTLDAHNFERERRLLKAGLAEVIDAVPVGQESATIWDDAVLETRSGDQAWMQENLGEWMGSYFGFDAALVLDEEDAPIHVMRDGVTLAPALSETEQAAIEPLIAQVRSDIAATSADDVLPYEEGAELGRMAIADLAGEPVVISVKPIVPAGADLLLPADQVYLHVAIQNLDEAVLLAVSEHFELDGLTLLPPGAGQVGEPLLASDGAILGTLVWNSERPAMQLLGRLLPAGLGCGLVLVGLASWLLGRLKQTAHRQKSAEERALYESLHDPLTDLANRDRLDELLTVRIAEGPAVLHVLDIDLFSSINDTLGYAAGDDLLCEVSDRLMEIAADTGSVARFGGDEFAVLQSLPVGTDADCLADRVMAEFDRPFMLAGESVPVRCCVGTAVSDGDVDGKELFRRANIALSRARSIGRGRRMQFAEGMDAVVLRRNRLEKDLRRAVSQPGELTVAYQAILAADGHTLSGAEALVRWQHPVEGNIPPDVFIEIAEDRGLIEAVGELVLREACACAASCDLPWVAVNVSPMQLHSAVFCERVFAILAETGLEPHRLQLEITEGTLLENTGVAQITLQRLRHRGIRIALDDFGTGFSSMNYLAKYAVDKIKIDKSFVARLATSQQSRAIVRAIVDLAYAFQLDTTAEGVETPDQRDHLAAIGCQELQGFLFSRPLERAAFELYVDDLRDASGEQKRIA